MSNLLNAVKKKLNILNRNPKLKIMLISVLALLLIFSVTLAWYINKVEIFGMEFQTGTIDFNTYVYDQNGVLKASVSSEEEDLGKYMNESLIRLTNGDSQSILTGYIGVESVGTIGIDYQVLFGIEGLTEKNYAFLGGYKYKITDVTEQIGLNSATKLNGDVTVPTSGPSPEQITDEAITIDRNAIRGTLEEKNDYHIYRVDFCLPEHVEEYTGDGIKIYFNIKAVQMGGDFDSDEERGKIWNCASDTDIDKVKVEAYPGDIIRLTKDITYYGDLVFNKPVTIETNDHNLTVYGNLMYDYALSTALRIDAGGKGVIQVLCTVDGIGGNFQIKAPLGNVTIIGSNAAAGDIVVEKNIILGSTNAYGANGLILSTVKFLDPGQGMKAVNLESNTRATVAFDTTIGILQSTANANYIEIENNGTIHEINLSNMKLLPTYENINNQSPQIYILNNSIISNPIALPSWSVKFVELANGKFEGNTRIIQGITASTTKVSGNCNFSNEDVEKEHTDILVEQIEEGKDNRLKIYYQDIEGQPTNTIESILMDYLENQATTGITLSQIEQLEIISIDGKAVTIEDIEFMNSRDMLYLKNLNLQRADVYDAKTDKVGRLPDNAFYEVSKYETLILPQNLVAIGATAFASSEINSIITIPAGVTEFGNAWFLDAMYVRFAASIPVAIPARSLSGVQAVFVDEAYIASYKSEYSDVATRIYPVSEMDEKKEHFVRNTVNNDWEITYFIDGEEPIIGSNITINGVNLNITSIYDNAYRHNFTGSQVVLAPSVKKIGAYNFYGIKVISNVELKSVESLGEYVFAECSGLVTVDFGDSLQSIGSHAFYNCLGLNGEVSLPDSMQKIGGYAFYKTPISSVNTGGTVSIDGYAFSYCTELLTADLPNVKYIGEDGADFLFDWSSKLVSVRMPAFIKSYGSKMFGQCTSLREIYLGTNDEGLNMGSLPFTGCQMDKLKLFVPLEHIDFFRGKRPGNIAASMIYPEGEKLGEQLVNGFNIGNYIVRNNEDGTYTLITSNIHYTDSLSIPESFEGAPITAVYDYAFANQNLTNVTLKLGNTLESIGTGAFSNHVGILKVEFGSSLKVIGERAFAYCKNLVQDMELPSSMVSIGREAFIDTGILSMNTGGATSIETRAFAECRSMNHIIMPEVVIIAESGENELFRNCSSLVSADMPKVSKVYGSYLFRACTSLREIYMAHGDSDVTLGSMPFVGIADSQTKLVKLFVPEELLTMYQEKKVIDVTRIYPQGEKLGDLSINGFRIGDYIVLSNGEEYTLITSNLELSGDVIVPDTFEGKPITEIYTNAFRNQSFSDVNLILGDHVQTIGDYAFYTINGLKSIVMDGVTSIGIESFYNSSIHTLNAPALVNIGDNAFRKCASLESIHIPKVERLDGSYIFAECTSLKSVYFENILSAAHYTFYNDKNLEKITINRTILSKADLPAEFTINGDAPCKIYVPYQALSYYSPEGAKWSGKEVVSFDISALYNEDTYILSERNGKFTLINLETNKQHSSLVLPETLAVDDIGNISIFAIDDGALSAVSGSLKDLTLPSTLVQLDSSAFSECSSLENIYVASGNATYSSVNGVLYSADGRILVKYPVGRSGEFDMTDSQYASTVGIVANAFANAKKLSGITFPAGLSVIDSKAFVNCTALKSVTFTGATAPTLMGVDIFDTTVKEFVMRIPTAYSTVYQSAYNFAQYEAFMVLY